MKKIIIILVLSILIVGCSNKSKTVTKKVKKEQIKENYTDLNETKIGLYQEKQNKLELIKEYKTDITSGVDIGIFQIYPSTDSEIFLENSFGNSFYNAWIKNSNYKDLKIGFNLKYTLDDNTNINHTVLNPSTTIKNSYIFTYLYDDYKNRNSNFYSHIEDSEYDDNSLFTSIKLYASDVNKLNSKITLSVFTYDTEDDFTKDGDYKGNSIYTITICDINKNCDL